MRGEDFRQAHAAFKQVGQRITIEGSKEVVARLVDNLSKATGSGNYATVLFGVEAFHLRIDAVKTMIQLRRLRVGRPSDLWHILPRQFESIIARSQEPWAGTRTGSCYGDSRSSDGGILTVAE